MMMIGRGVRRIRQGVVGWQRAFSIQGQAFGRGRWQRIRIRNGLEVVGQAADR